MLLYVIIISLPVQWLQCAREQMGIRANGNLAPKFVASYSRANGNSSKWECSQKNHAEWLKMGTFLVKWDSFEHSNAPKHQNGKPISLQVIREQMGIRANGNIPGISCNWSLNGIPFARERTVRYLRALQNHRIWASNSKGKWSNQMSCTYISCAWKHTNLHGFCGYCRMLRVCITCTVFLTTFSLSGRFP